MQYVNGHPSMTKGLWTRDRGHSKSVVDYVAISEKHLHTVKQSEIDDKGKYGGGLTIIGCSFVVENNIISKKMVLNNCYRKHKWKIGLEYNFPELADVGPMSRTQSRNFPLPQYREGRGEVTRSNLKAVKMNSIYTSRIPGVYGWQGGT